MSRLELPRLRLPEGALVETRPSAARVAYLDNVKLLLVAVIIAGHGALAYSTLESAWPYQDIQEVQLGTAADLVLLMAVIPAALFAMGLFFLISGLVTPRSLARKGPTTFARDRLIRLGVGRWRCGRRSPGPGRSGSRTRPPGIRARSGTNCSWTRTRSSIRARCGSSKSS